MAAAEAEVASREERVGKIEEFGKLLADVAGVDLMDAETQQFAEFGSWAPPLMPASCALPLRGKTTLYGLLRPAPPAVGAEDAGEGAAAEAAEPEKPAPVPLVLTLPALERDPLVDEMLKLLHEKKEK